jgi:hypothetical protein
MRAKSSIATSATAYEMKKIAFSSALRLAIGGAFLGAALTNIGAMLIFGVDPPPLVNFFGASAAGGASFVVLAKAFHLFG